MIHIEKDQLVPEYENLRTLSDSGDYNDDDIIECYNPDDSSIAICGFTSSFIKYGGLMYRFNDPAELGAEILKIDPESTHSAASFVRMKEELSKKMDEGSLEPESLQQALKEEQTMMEEKINEPDPEIDTEEIPEEEVPPETEPEIIPDSETEIIPDPETEPEIIPEPEPPIETEPEPIIEPEPTTPDPTVSTLSRKGKKFF
ncbi:MAG: hypothetical protein WC609_03275 [Candidatus Paceibacterota bacterium]|jgi:hypothetical protein